VGFLSVHVLLSDDCDRLSAEVAILQEREYAKLTSPLFAFTECRGITKLTMLPHQIFAKRFPPYSRSYRNSARYVRDVSFLMDLFTSNVISIWGRLVFGSDWVELLSEH
jgi:hypothetical protein